MRQVFSILIVLIFTNSILFAKDRNIARGATSGELYLTGEWYGIYDKNWGPPYYDTLKTAIYRLTENGRKLTKQYDANYFANPEIIMQPNIILADATSGVIYSKHNYSKNSYSHTQLWVSLDYGENWIFREEDFGPKGYHEANVDGLIYRTGTDGYFISEDYGASFSLIVIGTPGGESGLQKEEFFALRNGSLPGQYKLFHTYDLSITYSLMPIDSQFMFGQICGIFPDVYRGGLPGEVYISSLFPGAGYKVSFSADTGHTFRHVFVQNEAYCDQPGFPVFMSDREPGVFYIVRSYQIEDKDPWGWHTKICVEYYRDYGETLVDTYCHDITKDYGNEVGVEPITNYELRITVYPNPAFTTITIEAENFSKVEIYNIFGQLLQTAKTRVVDISYFNAGIYFLKIYTEKGMVVKKVIKN